MYFSYWKNFSFSDYFDMYRKNSDQIFAVFCFIQKNLLRYKQNIIFKDLHKVAICSRDQSFITWAVRDEANDSERMKNVFYKNLIRHHININIYYPTFIYTCIDLKLWYINKNIEGDMHATSTLWIKVFKGVRKIRTAHTYIKYIINTCCCVNLLRYSNLHDNFVIKYGYCMNFQVILSYCCISKSIAKFSKIRNKNKANVKWYRMIQGANVLTWCWWVGYLLRKNFRCEKIYSSEIHKICSFPTIWLV